MTNEELLSVAEIVERLVARFHKQAADHEAKMFEHRAAFGARTKADAETIDRLHTERDALRAEVAELKTQLERLTSWAAKNQAARETLQTELETLKSQASKHPVKVGGIQLGDKLRLVKQPPGWSAQWGKTGDVATVSEDNGIVFKMDTGYTWPLSCIEFVTEATHDTPEGRSVVESVIRDDRNTEPKPGDTVRLMRTPTHRDYPATWEGRWGLVGREAVVVSMSSRGAHRLVGVTFADGRFREWPLSCVEVVRTEPDDIKVGDLVEVVSNRGRNTWLADVGSLGTVTSVEEINESISVCLDDVPGKQNALAGYVSLCDVRKVTT